MIKKQKNIDRLLRNKKLRFLIVIVVMISFYTCNNLLLGNSHLYKKLQGDYNAVLEQMYIDRSVDFKPLNFNISFKKSEVELPIMQLGQEGLSYSELKELENNSKGTWEIISKNPDSILIETPASLLNGKYAVIFQKEEIFAKAPRYLLILQNDSTRLCFYKDITPACDLDW